MPRVVDHVERRAHVARAARAVIARDGLEGASVRRVAEEAGSSTTVVTHYFDGKEALLLAAIEDAYAAVASRMAARLAEEHGSAIDALRACLLEALPLDAVRRAEARVWMAFWAAATANPRLRDTQRDGYAQWRALVAGILGAADGRAVDAPPTPAATAEAERLLCLVDGMLMQSTLEPDRLPPERLEAMLDAELDRLRRP